MQSTGSRFYVSGLFDRLVGRGLDGSTHAPLISLADRPASGPIGRQIQGAYINPFHASFIRELGMLVPRQTAASSKWASNGFPVLRMLQLIRASLLARATASLLRCKRFEAAVSQAPKLNRSQF